MSTHPTGEPALETVAATVDRRAQAIYVHLDAAAMVATTRELSDTVNGDYDKVGNLVAVEVLGINIPAEQAVRTIVAAAPVPQGTVDTDYRIAAAKTAMDAWLSRAVLCEHTQIVPVGELVDAVLSVPHPDTAEVARLRAELAEARRELESFIEVSLDECDYTSDGESGGWEPDDYARAKANIAEMHRVLLVRMERLFQAQDREKAIRERGEQAAKNARIMRSRVADLEQERDQLLARTPEWYSSLRNALVLIGHHTGYAEQDLAGLPEHVRSRVADLEGQLAEAQRANEPAFRALHTIALMLDIPADADLSLDALVEAVRAREAKVESQLARVAAQRDEWVKEAACTSSGAAVDLIDGWLGGTAEEGPQS